MKKKALIISYSEWYNERQEAIKEVLCEKYDTLILVSNFNHINKNYIEKKHPECTYIHVPAYKKNISIRRIISYIYFALQIRKWIKKIVPDLIYLQVPPNYTEKFCLQYRLDHPESKYIIDLIDLWPESLPFNKLKTIPLMKYWAKLRNKSLKKADYVFVECALYKYKLKNFISDNKCKVLYLFKEYDKEDKKLLKEVTERIKNQHKNKKCKELLIAYLGSINNIIDIEGICKVLLTLILNNYKISVEIIGEGENKDNFIFRLQGIGCSVHYHGKVFDTRKKIELIGQCDYALNMMKKDVAVGLTIKSIDYFSMGLPIINNIHGDTWKLVDKYQVGINVIPDNLNGFVDMIEDTTVNRREAAYHLYMKYFTRQSFTTVVREGINALTIMANES